MNDDIIGELRGAFDRRDWVEVATILAHAEEGEPRDQAYEWLRASVANALREPESGALFLATLLAPIAGERRATVIHLGRSDSHERREVALGDDGILRERVLTELEDGSHERSWVLVEARSIYTGVEVPSTWRVAHKTNESNERTIFLEGEDGSFWQVFYGGSYRDRWILNRWAHGRYEPE